MKPKDDKKIEQIYKATLELVQEYGLAGITMNKIAKSSEMATGTIYIYFDSKEELVNTLFTECRKASAAIYFTGYDPGMTFKQGFKVIWMNLLKYRVKKFEEAVFVDQCYHSPFITESTKEITRQLFQPLHKLMDQGKKEGLVKELDTFLLLTFMIGSIREIVKYYHYSDRKITADIAEQAFHLCWDGLKA